ncbi:hypothetical protein VPHK435_0033 [Vibrio phage K435]
MSDEFWQLQRDANLSNKECAEWLKVTTRSIVKWRKSKPESPHAVIIALQYRIKHGEII